MAASSSTEVSCKSIATSVISGESRLRAYEALPERGAQQANNTRGFQPAVDGAAVYLGNSTNCTVVGGGNNKESVVVSGGAGNVVTGVTPHSGSAIGQALRDARARIQAARKAARLPY